ncbi:hypothetical protein [Nocardioides halotolerans]|uniref:hypothetical protein n=1 Tax=Nocardioides halotolerans TaxID=433660 RepID=UPI0012FBBFE7|nr:hypothetical protein [Nocardioides halotolerans]
MPQDPAAMGRAIQAIMAQAGAWVTQYKADLAARGLGFTPDDLTAVAASATAHPTPPAAADPAAEAAEMEQVRQAALTAEYPETGFAPDDPRLAPVGMPLVTYAIAAKAVGWANGDDALVQRVVTALGHTREDYDAAGAHWTPLLKTDMAVATLYGQLFANVGELPARPA